MDISVGLAKGDKCDTSGLWVDASTLLKPGDPRGGQVESGFTDALVCSKVLSASDRHDASFAAVRTRSGTAEDTDARALSDELDAPLT
jgi:hypothetical protein